ncbi:hypothetical protein J3Q64DRAFT_1709508 [Phycomyces blakesleeanus]|uniref:SAM domain-containing protein n=2 Tax=Phycomyces blakesleeanus TaxID=4837 RepID=A0A167KGG1_PHYB8|nr:hypothetical protein PHYBLDRAFT_188782 [Phycomyces blakesleeanus NRRL 1555(-)]OAD68037.1 hypothetical protein PHYBLDRAFT_188782 [Phycomyces blakesleeanus NRRL 1555(-)]|eukprot:XP_018286077.1 hypothetical protein PHYBLDRAFT_188782 [Phycomyces blakesleeanus NRRL 1555(-)]
MSQQPRRFNDQQMVKAFLSDNCLSQYCERMIDEGFDQLRSVYDVTESDLASMGVKRGHRRMLQKAIADAKGTSPSLSVDTDKNGPGKYMGEHSMLIRWLQSTQY